MINNLEPMEAEDFSQKSEQNMIVYDPYTYITTEIIYSKNINILQ